MQISISVSVPVSSLSPNSREHWAEKAKAKKTARTAAKVLTLVEMRGAGVGGGWKAATARIKWFDKQEYGRDQDNSLGMLKAVLDGIADSGLLYGGKDKGLLPYPIEFKIDAKNPRVEIILNEFDSRLPLPSLEDPKPIDPELLRGLGANPQR